MLIQQGNLSSVYSQAPSTTAGTKANNEFEPNEEWSIKITLKFIANMGDNDKRLTIITLYQFCFKMCKWKVNTNILF